MYLTLYVRKNDILNIAENIKDYLEILFYNKGADVTIEYDVIYKNNVFYFNFDITNIDFNEIEDYDELEINKDDIENAINKSLYRINATNVSVDPDFKHIKCEISKYSMIEELNAHLNLNSLTIKGIEEDIY